MTTTDLDPRPRARPARETAAVWCLVTLCPVATLHAVAVTLQPVWAGLYLGARYEMLDVHWTGANVVFVAGLVQVALALAYWPLARAAGWAALASVALAGAETVQFFAGLDGDLAVHVPLGVGIVVGTLAVTVLLWRRLLATRAGR